MEINFIPELKRIAFIRNYLPRQCGIATFTTDLSDAFSEKFSDIQTMVLAMNDTPEGYVYPDKVRYELRENNLFDYERAANFLNQQAVDAISLQHEFGIFGGKWGRNILTLLRNVNAPVVTTLHTVLEKPDPEQLEVLPDVVKEYPDLLYLVLGATHPHVVAFEGESYREELQARVKELGLEENVMFFDQFVTLKDLKEFIGAANVYITPYLDPEQVV